MREQPAIAHKNGPIKPQTHEAVCAFERDRQRAQGGGANMLRLTRVCSVTERSVSSGHRGSGEGLCLLQKHPEC